MSKKQNILSRHRMPILKKHKIAVFIAILLAISIIVTSFAAQNIRKPESKPSPEPSISPTPLLTSPPISKTPTISASASSTAFPLPTSIPTLTPTLTSTLTTSPSTGTPIVPPTPNPPPVQLPSPLIVLYPGEVLDYQGQAFDPIGKVYQNAIAGIQYLNQTTYTLTIRGLVNNTLNYTYNQVVSHQSYEKVVTIYCVEGWNATILWQGVLLKDLLDDAGITSEAKVVIFYASDGYSTALPIDYVVQNDIILAYKMNSVPLLPELGWPFMLVAQSQYGYKWIKWITEIEVSNDVNYLGYWESRGYPNNAEIP